MSETRHNGHVRPQSLLLSVAGISNLMTSQQKSILCVEDDASSAELLSAILHEHKVRSAPTVSHALEFIREEIFDYIILDQQLPDGTGLELCNRIRLFDKRVPII